jgi:RNA polymerase sigma-70 factor (ECF subfamily)
LKKENRVHSWIFQITRNTIIDYFRSKKNNHILTNDFPELEEDNPNESFNIILEDMIRNLDKLPPEYCDALCKTEFRGVSQKQYANEIGISYSGLKSRVQRARKILKDNLLQCCHFYFDKYNTIIDYEKRCCCCNDNQQN